ncbi:MAG: hypothetical protein ACRC4M_05170 [Mycoplasma sp.]
MSDLNLVHSIHDNNKQQELLINLHNLGQLVNFIENYYNKNNQEPIMLESLLHKVEWTINSINKNFNLPQNISIIENKKGLDKKLTNITKKYFVNPQLTSNQKTKSIIFSNIETIWETTQNLSYVFNDKNNAYYNTNLEVDINKIVFSLQDIVKNINFFNSSLNYDYRMKVS